MCDMGWGLCKGQGCEAPQAPACIAGELLITAMGRSHELKLQQEHDCKVMNSHRFSGPFFSQTAVSCGYSLSVELYMLGELCLRPADPPLVDVMPLPSLMRPAPYLRYAYLVHMRCYVS